MKTLLPPDTNVRVIARPRELTAAALTAADGVILLLPAGTDGVSALSRLPHAPLWRSLHAAEARGGNPAPILAARLPDGRHTLIVVGFAKAGATGFERLALAGKLAHEVLKPGVARVQLHAVDLEDGAADGWLEAVVSALLAHAAPMPHWKSKPEAAPALRRIDVASAPSPAYGRSVAIAAGNHLARWLATLPPNELDTAGYRRLLQQLARREGWSFRYHDVAALEDMGAGAFLAVARANPHRAAGIARLTYRPEPARARRAPVLALVGKGICFDTGGINLKPHKSMYAMHGDMQGSSVALGTLLALSRLGAPYLIDCWLAITENQIGPHAFRPQEVVRAVNGVTIQVVHSDAEGRMVLADALALASRERPRFVVDFATLTGACVVALTDRYSGAFTNRPALHDWLQQVGRDSGERVWCFPMDEDFDVELESKVADVLQCTPDSKGDHILAARFLSRFVEPGVPWVHLDLAASDHKDGLAHVPTEFTGFGVRYAVHLLGDPDALDSALQAAP
jgi:leucyl aminopeptidase